MPRIKVRMGMVGNNVWYFRQVANPMTLWLSKKWVMWRSPNIARNESEERLNDLSRRILKEMEVYRNLNEIIKEKTDFVKKNSNADRGEKTADLYIDVDKKDVKFNQQKYTPEPKKYYEEVLKSELYSSKKRMPIFEKFGIKANSAGPHGTSIVFRPDVGKLKEFSVSSNSLMDDSVDDFVTYNPSSERKKPSSGKGDGKWNPKNRRKGESEEDYQQRQERIREGNAESDDYRPNI